MLPTCKQAGAAELDTIEILYPAGDADIYIPIGFKGDKEKIVLKAAHSRKDATLYWYLDSEYLGCTNDFHDMALSPKEGKYCITITDDKGISKSFGIRIYER